MALAVGVAGGAAAGLYWMVPLTASGPANPVRVLRTADPLLQPLAARSAEPVAAPVTEPVIAAAFPGEPVLADVSTSEPALAVASTSEPVPVPEPPAESETSEVRATEALQPEPVPRPDDPTTLTAQAPVPATVPAAEAPAPQAAVAESTETLATVAAWETLDRWVSAWARRDMGTYLASYDNGFKGRHANRDDWVRERTQRIAGRAWIEVQLSNIAETHEASGVAFTFTQTYRSPGFSDTTERRVRLKPVADRWLIVEESDR
jgi:hypothetical protein